MQRLLPIKIALFTLVSLCLALPMFTQADTGSYYATDLDEAVQSVKRNPINSNKVGTRWYGRSTSNSFGFPKLLNSEMDNEVIEGAMGPTAAGEAAVVAAQQPARDVAFDRKNQKSSLDGVSTDLRKTDLNNPVDSSEIDTTLYLHNSAKSETQFGSSYIRDIRGSSKIKSSICESPCR